MTAPQITRYPDPLRGKRDEQAVIVAQLFCAMCFCDVSNAPGLVDLKTGHAFCGADHWRKFFEKKGQKRV